MELGDPMALHGPHGTLLGDGPNTVVGASLRPATTLFLAQSATGTGTSLLVTQYY